MVTSIQFGVPEESEARLKGHYFNLDAGSFGSSEIARRNFIGVKKPKG
jgi:hypothetical protein